jgi:anti-sigma factor RsiW
MMEERILELLHRSFDGELGPAERKELESALARSAELRRERDELLAVRGAVKSSAADSFSPFFAERVIRAVREEREGEAEGARFFESLLGTFRRVALVAAAIAAFLLVYNMNQGGSVSVAAAFGAEESTSVEQVLTAPVKEMLEELL